MLLASCEWNKSRPHAEVAPLFLIDYDRPEIMIFFRKYQENANHDLDQFCTLVENESVLQKFEIRSIAPNAAAIIYCKGK